MIKKYLLAICFIALLGVTTAAQAACPAGFPVGTTCVQIRSADVTTALGYTPLQSISSSNVTTALGFTPIPAQTPSVYTGTPGASWLSSVFGFNDGALYNVGNTPFIGVSTNGQFGGLFASRSSDYNLHAYTAAGTFVTLHDNPTTAYETWGQYIQTEFLSTAHSGQQLFGVENSLWNQKTVVALDPFTTNVPDATINERLDCGVGSGGPTPKIDCTTALQIINNGASYSSPAIVIGSTAMDTTSIPNPATIAMPAQDAIAWYSSAGVQGALMYAGAGSPAGVVSCTARCLYIRTDGGSGSTLYVNETGGGTSGWAAK